MKITEAQLRQIIKEEVQGLAEANFPKFQPGAKYSDAHFKAMILAASSFLARSHKAFDRIGQDEIVDDLERIMDKLKGMGIQF